MKITKPNPFSNLQTKPKILIGFCVPIAMLMILGGVSVFSVKSIVETNEWVDHTNKAIARSSSIVGSAVNMETGMRGYLLAGKEAFLDPYKGGQEATYSAIADLQKTVGDNPRQVDRLAAAEKVLKEWQQNVTEPTIALRRKIGDAKTMDDMAKLVGEARGKQFFDKFRSQIGTFINREEKLLVRRRKDFGTAFEKLRGSSSVDVALLKEMSENEKWVTHTFRVIAQANDILAAAVDMETGMRGYLLAGKEEFLDPYKGGQDRFFKLIAALRETVNDNPAQVILLTETEQTIKDWVANVTQPTIALRRNIGDAKKMNDMAKLIGEARGKQYFDKFRQIMADFSAEEQGLMKGRQASSNSTVRFTYILVGLCLGLGLLIGLGLAWLIGNGIANPIRRMTDVMGTLAGGNHQIEVSDRERKDEVGAMAEAVQVFKENMIENERLVFEQKEAEKRAAGEQAKREEEDIQRGEDEKAAEAEAEAQRKNAMIEMADNFEKSVMGVVSSLSSAATEMQTSAETVSATAEQTSAQAIDVSAAAEQATVNVQTVASSAEELSASIEEIRRQVEQSNEMAQNAVTEAEMTNTKVEGLAGAAQKIGDVVSLINDIASQTNLLALNATIEAARAGDAGKGFAVVASEVKSLATQTGKATEEIASQISEIQDATGEAVQAIQGIGSIIGQLGEIASSVSAAVDQQGSATREIAGSVQQAAAGTQAVTGKITEVNQAAGETQETSSQMLGAAKELAQQGDLLQQEVEKFLQEVRAA